MVSDCIQLASLPILKNDVDIVVPKRNEESFSTYPKLQAEQEQKANKLYNQILRSHGLLKDNDPDLDFWFGQRFFANKPQIRELFKTIYTTPQSFCKNWYIPTVAFKMGVSLL